MIEVHLRHGDYSREAQGELTTEGLRQAGTAAKYLQQHFPQGFDRYYHSERRRAEHTAAVLDIPNTSWRIDSRLNEATWPQPWPTEFAPYQDFFNLVSSFCRDIDQHSSGSRLIVSHGGTMQMVRAYREGFVDEKFSLLFEKPYKYFTNCQIIIYSNTNPSTGQDNHKKLWVKSVCPWHPDELRFGHDWLEITLDK